MHLSHLPLRGTVGAYFLNSGLSKVGIAEPAAGELHGMAAGAIPPIRRIRPDVFATALAGVEIALGTALLLPVVPSALAGLGLLAFGGGLARLYWVTPGMREPGGPRPTQLGTALAKDVWLVGAGLTLVLDDLAGRVAGARRSRGRRTGRVAGRR